MPNWKQTMQEIQERAADNPLDVVRRKYLLTMHRYTERNVIAYYSAFLQKPSSSNVSIDDNDKNAFMQTIHGLDKSKGLDLLLHTPGGNLAATESIVTYLKSIFGNDIRVFIPQIAMSAGTMIALAAKEIVMGKQSNIGPIDPQFGGVSCAGLIEEFNTALIMLKENPASAPAWQPIIAKYSPAFLGDCQKAITWAASIVRQWLASNMLKYNANPEADAARIVEMLSSHKETYSHSRHIHIEECKDLGLCVTPLEKLDKKQIDGCEDLQDCVLTIHHAYMHTFSNSSAVKIVENHTGNAMVIHLSQR